MRTLKKSLCLVLAIVMVLGLGVFSVSATDFADDKDIQYKEAAEVLSAIGVIEGDETGFNPKKELTRAEGAVLIARLLGQSQSNGVSPFSDTADHDFWAGFAIQYCAANKIIEGTDDVKNTFEPDGKLTGSAFAKMLLVALGYDPATENLNGPDWEIGVAKLVNTTNLKGGIDDWNQNNNVTREVAAQMCLKALEATMVYYEGGMNVVTSDGTQVRSGGTRKDLENTGNDYRTSKANSKNDEKMQLCEMYFGKLKKQDNNLPSDGLSPTGHIWRLNDKDIYTATSNSIATFTKKTGASDISAALSSYYVRPYGATNDDTKYYINSSDRSAGVVTEAVVSVNGTPTATTIKRDKSSTTSVYVAADDTATVGTVKATNNVISFVQADSLANALNMLTDNGRKVEVYASDDDHPNRITDIVVTYYTVEEVTNVTTSSNKTTYRLSVANKSFEKTSTPADDTIKLEGGAKLAKGDFVTTTYEGVSLGKTIYAYPTDVFTGTQTSWNSDNELTISGSTYKVATGVYKSTGNFLTASSDFSNSNSDGDFYVDQYGFVVHSKAISSGNYAFIVGASGTLSNSVDDGETATITVRAILSDGTVGTYTVATKKLGSGDLKASTNNKYNGTTYRTSAGEDVTVPAGGAFAANDVVIKNTAVRVYVPGTTTTNSAVTTNATYLMNGSTHGYVYRYSLNSDNVMTLTPLKNANDEASLSSGTDYVGETVYSTTSDTGIKKSLNNYNVASATAAAGKFNVDNNSGTTGAQIKVTSTTKFVVYDRDTKTATIYNGTAEFPKTSKGNGTGYFVVDGSNAKYVFLNTGNGVSATNDKYAYVNAGKYTDSDDNGSDVRYYTAYAEDGTQFQLKNKDDIIAGTGSSYSGLYTYDENKNEVVAAKVVNKATPSSFDDTNNFTYVGNGDVDGNLIKASDGNWYNFAEANVTYIGDAENLATGSNYYLVFSTDSGDITGVKAVFVVE